jgi:adenylate cyclase
VGTVSTEPDDDDSGSRKVNIRFVLESAFIIALITAVAIFTRNTKIVDYLEKIVDDIAVSQFTPDSEKPHPRVAVVAIDDATINQLPWRSPINRKFLAKLLEILDKGKPAGIGIDITFFEESYDPSHDEALVAVLANMQTPVVLATGLKRDSAEALLERRPLIPVYENSPAITALVNLPVDNIDRTLRNFRTAFADDSGNLHLTMAAVLAREAGAEVPASVEDVPIDWYGRPSYQDRPLPGGGFFKPPPVATFSALSMIKAPMAAMLLKDKIVFVGATFEGSFDFLRTPFEIIGVKENSFAGVFGHAQIVAQLLDGRSRLVVGPAVGWLLVLGAVIIGMLLAFLRLPAIIPLILALLLPIGWILAVFYIRETTGYAVPALPPALGAGLSLATFALFRARRFDASSRVAAKALNSYLPPALARRVMNDPSLLKLGGEPRDLSILFTDIAGFTTYSENSPPDEVVSVLNTYLDRMADIVLEQNGTLDKFVGDAVMAFFGAPVSDAAHSSHAISCALEMDRFGREFERDSTLKTRIGVHTGNVIVGNVGGEQRFDYTVIGDAVNTAARLEGANKYLGTDPQHITTVCISGDTVSHCREAGEGNTPDGVMLINLTGDEMQARPDETVLRRIGKIVVKGRSVPLDVFTTVPDNYTAENLDSYNAGLDFLEAGSHEDAGKIFKNLYNDDLSAFQLLRCEKREEPSLTLTDK